VVDVDFSSPEFYINRELSFLEFNRRVLELAETPRVPLLERLKYLCITAANLDEFFAIRVAGLKHQAEFQPMASSFDGLTPAAQLQEIHAVTRKFVTDQYRILNELLIPDLAAHGICFIRRTEWNDVQTGWLQDYFRRELLPVLSPMGLDPAHPFPHVLNQSLNFIVTLRGKDAFGRSGDKAIVQAPRSLPRLVRLPDDCCREPYGFVFLSSIIHAFVKELFPGMQITGCYQFRCTRNSDLFVDEEAEDVLRAVAGELHARRFGDAVRLEVADDCPAGLTGFLRQQFNLQHTDVFCCQGPVNLTRLMAVPDQVDHPDLLYRSYTPSIPKQVLNNPDMFAAIRRGDLLLHHPYESFTPVVDFLEQAANDSQVLAIRQTLYRTGIKSKMARILVEAARRGKEVTVVVEIRARFDEQANIELASALQEAGAYVTYGVVGYKTHAKMMLIVRREGRQLRRYVHLGTGN